MRKIKLREPVSSLTHMLGIFLGIWGTILLLISASHYNNKVISISYLVFGITLILLYTFSALYHGINVSPDVVRIFRKIDHMMIFIFIAGSYTPIFLISLNSPLGNYLLILIWLIAILGILFKVFWFNAPRWLYTLLYIGMGWIAIFTINPLKEVLPNKALFYLFAGGITYTIGAVIYATKWPNFKNKYFGFHEVFHIFILGGSLFHFCMIYNFVV